MGCETAGTRLGGAKSAIRGRYIARRIAVFHRVISTFPQTPVENVLAPVESVHELGAVGQVGGDRGSLSDAFSVVARLGARSGSGKRRSSLAWSSRCAREGDRQRSAEHSPGAKGRDKRVTAKRDLSDLSPRKNAARNRRIVRIKCVSPP
jgi:hypothetical protein